MDIPAVPVCPKCGNTVFPTDEFCAHCGFRLSFQHQAFSFWKITWIVIVSFFLPPLGLIWTFKYFRSSIQSEKKVALLSFILTVVSIILNIWIGFGIISAVNQQLSGYTNQINSFGL